MMNKKREDIIALHLEMWLTPDCHINLTVSGRITAEAIKRLIALVELTATPDAVNPAAEKGQVVESTPLDCEECGERWPLKKSGGRYLCEGCWSETDG